MPDENKPTPSEDFGGGLSGTHTPEPDDLMTQVAEFIRFFPSWTTKDGLPMSWRHFVIGIRFLSRDAVMRVVDQAAAVRAGKTSQKEYENWRRGLMSKV